MHLPLRACRIIVNNFVYCFTLSSLSSRIVRALFSVSKVDIWLLSHGRTPSKLLCTNNPIWACIEIMPIVVIGVMFSSVTVMLAMGWTSRVGTKGTDLLWDILDHGTDIYVAPLQPALGEQYTKVSSAVCWADSVFLLFLKVAIQILGRKFYKNTTESSLYSKSHS